MTDEFRKCVRGRKIIKSSGIERKTELEIRAAKEDLKEAENRFRVGKFKYATVNAYYSLFHSARALLYQRGYRERGHYCLLIAVKELYVKEKLLDSKLLESFENAIGLREAADYGGIYSRSGARRAIEGAEEFLFAAREILKK